MVPVVDLFLLRVYGEDESLELVRVASGQVGVLLLWFLQILHPALERFRVESFLGRDRLWIIEAGGGPEVPGGFCGENFTELRGLGAEEVGDRRLLIVDLLLMSFICSDHI